MATINGMLGRKVGMTSIFTAEGQVVPVTVIECGPCTVVQEKTEARDGYQAVQLGLVALPAGRRDTKVARGDSGHRGRGEANKPLAGHFQRHGQGQPTRFLAEFRLVAEGDTPVAGSQITVDSLFKAGDMVHVQGTSKGRGFAGAMKRHHFSGQGASHGAKIHRKPASGGATDPARTFPGARRPGHMGAALITQPGLQVVGVDAGRHLLLVRGTVPGAPGGLVRINQAPRRGAQRQK